MNAPNMTKTIAQIAVALALIAVPLAAAHHNGSHSGGSATGAGTTSTSGPAPSGRLRCSPERTTPLVGESQEFVSSGGTPPYRWPQTGEQGARITKSFASPGLYTVSVQDSKGTWAYCQAGVGLATPARYYLHRHSDNAVQELSYGGTTAMTRTGPGTEAPALHSFEMAPQFPSKKSWGMLRVSEPVVIDGLDVEVRVWGDAGDGAPVGALVRLYELPTAAGRAPQEHGVARLEFQQATATLGPAGHVMGEWVATFEGVTSTQWAPWVLYIDIYPDAATTQRTLYYDAPSTPSCVALDMTGCV